MQKSKEIPVGEKGERNVKEKGEEERTNKDKLTKTELIKGKERGGERGQWKKCQATKKRRKRTDKKTGQRDEQEEE